MPPCLIQGGRRGSSRGLLVGLKRIEIGLIHSLGDAQLLKSILIGLIGRFIRGMLLAIGSLSLGKPLSRYSRPVTRGRQGLVGRSHDPLRIMHSVDGRGHHPVEFGITHPTANIHVLKADPLGALVAIGAYNHVFLGPGQGVLSLGHRPDGILVGFGDAIKSPISLSSTPHSPVKCLLGTGNHLVFSMSTLMPQMGTSVIGHRVVVILSRIVILKARFITRPGHGPHLLFGLLHRAFGLRKRLAGTAVVAARIKIVLEPMRSTRRKPIKLSTSKPHGLLGLLVGTLGLSKRGVTVLVGLDGSLVIGILSCTALLLGLAKRLVGTVTLLAGLTHNLLGGLHLGLQGIYIGTGRHSSLVDIPGLFEVRLSLALVFLGLTQGVVGGLLDGASLVIGLLSLREVTGHNVFAAAHRLHVGVIALPKLLNRIGFAALFVLEGLFVDITCRGTSPEISGGKTSTLHLERRVDDVDVVPNVLRGTVLGLNPGIDDTLVGLVVSVGSLTLHRLAAQNGYGLVKDLLFLVIPLAEGLLHAGGPREILSHLIVYRHLVVIPNTAAGIVGVVSGGDAEGHKGGVDLQGLEAYLLAILVAQSSHLKGGVQVIKVAGCDRGFVGSVCHVGRVCPQRTTLDALDCLGRGSLADEVPKACGPIAIGMGKFHSSLCLVKKLLRRLHRRVSLLGSLQSSGNGSIGLVGCLLGHCVIRRCLFDSLLGAGKLGQPGLVFSLGLSFGLHGGLIGSLGGLGLGLHLRVFFLSLLVGLVGLVSRTDEGFVLRLSSSIVLRGTLIGLVCLGIGLLSCGYSTRIAVPSLSDDALVGALSLVHLGLGTGDGLGSFA